METYTITDETPISALNVGQLKRLLSITTPKVEIDKVEGYDKNYVYGLRGIRGLFNCGHSTAQRYKNTWLAPAVTQEGMKLRIDKSMALELFGKHSKDRKLK